MISTIGFIIICLACITQIVYLILKKTEPFSHFLLLAASLLLFAETTVRSVKIQFVAVTNTFESLIFFSATICLVLFIYRLRSGSRSFPFVVFGGTITAIILLAIASSPLASCTRIPVHVIFRTTKKAIGIPLGNY